MMIRENFKRLILNKMPEIIPKNGNGLEFREIQEEELLLALKNKLLEEAKEAMQAKNLNQLILELADIKEVIRELEEITIRRSKKGHFTEWVEKKRH